MSLSDLFYYKNTDYETFDDETFKQLWSENPIRMKNIMLYLRSHRNGEPGYRDIFYKYLIWMSKNHQSSLCVLLNSIPDCGYWKDLFVLFGTSVEKHVIGFLALQLQKDFDSFNSKPPGLISLLAKWIPNEGSSHDKKYNSNLKIAQFLNLNRQTLRKKYLVPMRKYLSVVEQSISEKDWSHIDYNTVPKISMRMNFNVFMKHDKERFTEYNNKKYQPFMNKINLPLYAKIALYDSYVLPANNVVIKPWDSKCKLPLSDTVLIIDTSGSMSGFPMIISASLCVESNSKSWIPLDYEAPDAETVKKTEVVGKTIQNKIKNIINNNEKGYNIKDCLSLCGKEKYIFFLTNNKIDIDDYYNRTGATLVFWNIDLSQINISENKKEKIIFIEGYDIDLYCNIVKGNMMDRDKWFEIKINDFEKRLNL